jgi:glucosamine--fructose-6-phosphate aminotransferase (isomerizing)
MCGIIGYIGTKKAEPILINGLIRLEYRGYDSAGIATIEDTGIKNIKTKGRVNDLLNIPEIENLKGNIGIGHTRWATHGKPSSVNSHPHMDNSNTFAVVHNGIIENYAELRKSLESQGYTFLSETDTEVVPNLIHHFFTKSKLAGEMKFLSAVNETCKLLKGSFALEIISSLYPNSMIVVRKDSPLVIGTSSTENYISSDIPAILSFTKDFYLLNDLEFAYLSRDNITFYNNNLQEIKKNATSIEWNSASAEKDGFDDFMLKEIYEQPKSIRETIGSHIVPNGKCIIDGLELSKEYLQSINKIFIVACGTAMHAGLACKSVLEQICEISTEVDVASEFRYRKPLINEKTLCIFISQSGETADTIAALKLAKEKGSKTIAISNVIGSSISREADHTIYTHAGPEIAVASTKAYTAQIMLLDILAIYIAETLEKNLDKVEILKNELLEVPSKVEECLKLADEVKEFAHKVYKEKDIFFLGRGIDYSSSLEASLKLKEISYIHSDAYPAGELKHGPIALIENDITVIALLTVPYLVEKSISNIQEVITRGAKTLIVTNQDLGDKKFDKVIRIPETSEYVSPILAIIPMQLFAYYISKEKGLDVDKPRNLAKSVTVE